MRKISFKVLTLSCILFLIFIGCKNEKKQVEKNLEQMMSQPVSLGLEKMQCRRAPIKDNGSHYKMVVYIDSTECTPCSLSKLRFWNPLIKKARTAKKGIDYVFIVAPKPSEMDDINLELSITDLKSSIYLDTAYIFRKENPSIPSDRKYHSFLLDKNGKICFVGSPIDNEKIKAIYGKTIGPKQ